jgi:ribonuclease P protein component
MRAALPESRTVVLTGASPRVEAHVPAVQVEAEPDPRLPQAKQHPGRQGRAPSASCQGPQASGRVRGQEVGLSEAFPREARLLSRRDFLEVQERGTKVTAGPLVGLVAASPDGKSRLGLTVSSKVGTAVVRNAVRRRLRELFRKRSDRWPKGMHLVVVARPSAREASFAATERAVDALLTALEKSLR